MAPAHIDPNAVPCGPWYAVLFVVGRRLDRDLHAGPAFDFKDFNLEDFSKAIEEIAAKKRAKKSKS
jgi:hypothetical protein